MKASTLHKTIEEKNERFRKCSNLFFKVSTGLVFSFRRSLSSYTSSSIFTVTSSMFYRLHKNQKCLLLDNTFGYDLLGTYLTSIVELFLNY